MTSFEVMCRESICARLQLLWEASQLSQRDFARLIGITPQALSNYFSLTRTPSHALIYRVCRIYALSPADFYPPVPARRTPTATQGDAPAPTAPDDDLGA